MRLNYSFVETVQCKIVQYLMPTITLFLFSNRLNTFFWKLLGLKIGKGSLVIMGSKINTPYVTLGIGSIYEAGVVVTKDVAPWDIIAGVPTKTIGKRETPAVDFMNSKTI